MWLNACLLPSKGLVYMCEFILKDHIETLRLGEQFSSLLSGGEIVGLCGELGSGKTTFVKGVMNGLAYEGYVKSPTFTIVNSYKTKTLLVHHFDLYRLSSFEELNLMGFENYPGSDSVILIEWFDRFEELTRLNHIRVDFEYLDENTRRIHFSTNSPEYNDIIKKIQRLK